MSFATITACADDTLPGTPEMVELYDAVGWSAYTQDPESLMAGLRGSLRVVTGRAKGRLVGLARIVGDGATIPGRTFVRFSWRTR